MKKKKRVNHLQLLVINSKINNLLRLGHLNIEKVSKYFCFIMINNSINCLILILTKRLNQKFKDCSSQDQNDYKICESKNKQK
jgi:hypothetical protein